MSLNVIELGLVFVEGLALIASPCILPVLPIVLSAAVDTGKLRPYGIIIGFILSFSLFALSSATLIKWFSLDLTIVKNVSLAILFLLGCFMLSTTLSAWFSRVTSPLSNKAQLLGAVPQKGFVSGIIIGSLIGIVWTPCAGPILAAALIQIIRQQNDVNSLLMILAFSVGVAIPMLIITLTGKTLLMRWDWLIKHVETVRKVLGLFIILSVIYIAMGMTLPHFQATKEVNPLHDQKTLINPLPISYQAPEFSDIQAWINSSPLTMKQLIGKVVLIDFWTYSCINCIRTLPYVKGWDQKYRQYGLVVVGVHSPEFIFEKDINNVEDAVKRFDITYPVALDNQLRTWQNFQNHFWPAHYLIDRNGRVVYTHFGEGEDEITEHNIRVLLNLGKEEKNTSEGTQHYLSDQTSETYLGYIRQENFVNKDSITKNQSAYYHFPERLRLHQWSLEGEWRFESEKIVSTGTNVAIRLHFKAKQVYLVMGNQTQKPITIRILLDGKSVNEIEVRGHQLYEILNLPAVKQGLLEIQCQVSGLEVYAFTFGNL
ncbi:redoxin family protein [Candidatus Berkiella aquae]|uniref:Cytochrome c biogenesis protein DipZ n=1 Tax=Candidatus Berkiella aquae TaxID=295108 RepID=A0A0Q9Z084_9GAMM|nr:cytochrome c biogenesis protein DipZ [Candidatus Berkiella aquae]MCS5710396.1 cytochrome c biogenesis protein DipZ [Candidatus Berkiella aquae]